MFVFRATHVLPGGASIIAARRAARIDAAVRERRRRPVGRRLPVGVVRLRRAGTRNAVPSVPIRFMLSVIDVVRRTNFERVSCFLSANAQLSTLDVFSKVETAAVPSEDLRL